MASEYDVQLEEILDPRPLAVVCRRARQQDLPNIVPEACGIVWGLVRARQIEGAGRHVAVYLDREINLEVGIELEAPFSGHGEVVGSAIPTGPVAKTVHVGPYPKLGEAHAAIVAWCARHGHSPAGPNWEIYGHWVDEWNRDPSQIRTDVFYLLKRR